MTYLVVSTTNRGVFTNEFDSVSEVKGFLRLYMELSPLALIEVFETKPVKLETLLDF